MVSCALLDRNALNPYSRRVVLREFISTVSYNVEVSITDCCVQSSSDFGRLHLSVTDRTGARGIGLFGVTVGARATQPGGAASIKMSVGGAPRCARLRAGFRPRGRGVPALGILSWLVGFVGFGIGIPGVRIP